MRVAAITITSLSFLWQVLAGGCPHHAHGSAHADSFFAESHDNDCHESEHSDDDHCDHDDSSQHPDGPAPCSCGQCRSIYLKADVTRIDSADLFAMGAVLALPADAQAGINLRALRRELLGPIHRSGPPLPLLFCALLL